MGVECVATFAVEAISLTGGITQFSLAIYDLGDPPHAVINVIRGEAEGRIYYVNKDDRDGGASIHPGLMCEQGGQYWYKPSSGPWEVVDVPQGFVASSMAASSFAMDMTENLI